MATRDKESPAVLSALSADLERRLESKGNRNFFLPAVIGIIANYRTFLFVPPRRLDIAGASPLFGASNQFAHVLRRSNVRS